jgi:hypothetical protein
MYPHIPPPAYEPAAKPGENRRSLCNTTQPTLVSTLLYPVISIETMITGYIGVLSVPVMVSVRLRWYLCVLCSCHDGYSRTSANL